MKRSTVLAVAAASLLALPAAAWGQNPARPAPPLAAPAPAPALVGAWTLDARQDWLVGRVHRALDEHDIDAGEADRVFAEVAGNRDHLKLIAARHAITPAERAAHETRLDAVVSRIHWLRADAFQRPW